MSKFKKKTKTSQKISTASLPDIVFMLLFFFMVTTKMREQDIMVEQHIPTATQLEKLQNKSLVSYVYIGKPTKAALYGTEPKIQVNDVFIDPPQIGNWVENEKSQIAEYDRDKLTISLKVDREAKMGIITDVKQKLREVNALKINYSSNQGEIGGED
ncbi:Biopolymer transport protein ExbD [Catalinimonas alkaloidigena]|uniref:Biopolymer transport protein ExbD n=1 Tax=Catalinimonas alkaloidigena TaxID=1075417 RepID=A0A1G8WK86_9BACT|nr:biopolymer transporter ExbD [Catalinimonas alkaloidigena]SDJ77990.1 Biopolymer transport protein ExbD [Catalinimonas alkaloidigena]